MYDIYMRNVNAIQLKETVMSTLFFVKTEIVVNIKIIEQIISYLEMNSSWFLNLKFDRFEAVSASKEELSC